MVPGPDELAGVVDGFGGLTRAELRAALDDLAARAGTTIDHDELDAAIDDALDGYYLFELEPAIAMSGQDDGAPDDPLLVAGPAALPTLPAGGEDLPHLLDVDPRPIDRDAVAHTVESALRGAAAVAIDEADDDQAERLLDACYAIEAWAPVDLADAKAGLADLVD